MLTETMIQKLEGENVSFLRQVTRKQEMRQRDGSWRKVPAQIVLQRSGTQALRAYVDRGQATVEEWVTTWHIFDICTQEIGYKGGDRLLVPWWRQKSAEDHLRFTVEAILAAAKVRRRHESGRHDGNEGGSEGGSTDSDE